MWRQVLRSVSHSRVIPTLSHPLLPPPMVFILSRAPQTDQSACGTSQTSQGVINHDNPAKPAAQSPDSAVLGKPSTGTGGVTACSRRDIATQYPPHLFPYPTFKIQDGWILGPNDELLLWVPPANRPGLLDPFPRSRVMGPTHITELDFSNFKCWMEWMQCREPIETE